MAARQQKDHLQKWNKIITTQITQINTHKQQTTTIDKKIELCRKFNACWLHYQNRN